MTNCLALCKMNIFIPSLGVISPNCLSFFFFLVKLEKLKAEPGFKDTVFQAHHNNTAAKKEIGQACAGFLLCKTNILSNYSIVRYEVNWSTHFVLNLI